MTKALAQKVSQSFSLNKQQVAVAATGIIGKPLPDKFTESLDTLLIDSHLKQGDKFAEGILTTDQGVKTAFIEQKIGKKTVSIAGVTKGCGMIEPNMATMLAFIFVDADLSLIHI